MNTDISIARVEPLFAPEESPNGLNKPLGLDLAFIRQIQIDPSAIERRVERITKGKTFKKQAQVDALIRSIQCMDLTTLDGGDTAGKVEELCAKALQPVRAEILEKLGITHPVQVASVCVYHNQIAKALEMLQGKIPVAAVSTGFPDGQAPRKTRLEEIRLSIAEGAKEIDIVICRELALSRNWEKLYEELCEFRQVCTVPLKVILGVGNLKELKLIAQASALAIMAGADFIKTSTGKEATNATLPVGVVMCRMIRHFRDQQTVSLKAAGGIKKAKEALQWLALVMEELDATATHPHYFRFGASSLLADIERQLTHAATGHYDADYYNPR